MQAPTILDLGFNEGTYAPRKALAALRTFADQTSLRHYSSADNRALREAIAHVDGVQPENVLLHHGSGPLLRLCMPRLMRSAITSSPLRIVRHLARKNGFPLISTSHTYGKVRNKAADLGYPARLLPLEPPGFHLQAAALGDALRARDGFVYLCNPNNPTGNVLIGQEALAPLLEAHPHSLFWIDEAYVQYLDPDEHPGFASWVRTYPHLVVSRSFSFAYGLAGLRIGYVLAAPEIIRDFDAQLPEYRLGDLQERVAIAALEDDEHLPFVREKIRHGRDFLRKTVGRFSGVEVFDSRTNFVLCRFVNGRPARELASGLAERGIRIKTFEPVPGQDVDAYFRLTVGLEEECVRLVREMAPVLGEADPTA